MKTIYRIKTEEEFIKEFGDNWKRQVYWSDEMNYLFGKEISQIEYEKAVKAQTCSGNLLKIYDRCYKRHWSVFSKMVTKENKSILPIAPSKTIYRIKTKDEFLKEFGLFWEEDVKWSKLMNHLFGEKLNKEEYEQAKKADSVNSIDVLKVYDKENYITWYIYILKWLHVKMNQVQGHLHILI